MKWKWSNVPIPDGHVVLLPAGIILHLFVPLKLFSLFWVGHALGWPLLVAGVLVVGWAVSVVKDMAISKPTKVVSTGPFAFSRNPMYVAWTLIYIGIALVVNTAWPLIFLPVVLIGTHYIGIIREERYLERKFGQEYQRYRAKVRRYL